jgi:amidase
VSEVERFLAAVGDDPLHAWAAIDPVQLQAAVPEGPLAGMLVGIKDNIDTAALPTAYGSPIYAEHRPLRDAAVVGRLRAAGALIAGKTVLTEFAWMHPAETLNPVAPGRTPGGSSCGSAAAVAAGHVPVALGTQTAGSLNRPASYCAIVGYKATFELIPTAGIKPLAPALDTVGIMARTVRDIQRVAGLVAGHLDRAPRDLGRLPRLGFARTPLWETEVEPEARAAIERSVETIGGVEEVELPDGFRELIAAQTLIQSVEAAHSLRDELERWPELLSRELREALQFGATVKPERYAGSQRLRAEYGPPLAELLSRYDGVLTPSTTGVPPHGLEFTGDPVFSRAWNLIGAPSVSLPLAFSAEGLPVGLQLVGAPGRDAALLAAAAALHD